MLDDTPEILKEYPEIAKAYGAYAIRKQALHQKAMRIAACGVYNAGKSSLLNVLANQFDPCAEAFKTGAVRETSEVSELKLPFATLIDMPGIDGALKDDEKAWQGVLGGDFYLYVHRLRSSEFEQGELDFLHMMKEKIRGLDARLILVISQIDEVRDAAEANRREAAIRQSFEQAIGFKPRWVFCVSAKRFVRGALEGKKELVKASGIPILQSWISEMSTTLTQSQMETFRADRLQSDRDAFKKVIMEVFDSLGDEAQHLKRKAEEKAERVKAFDKSVKNMLISIKRSFQSIDKVK